MEAGSFALLAFFSEGPLVNSLCVALATGMQGCQTR